MTFFASTLRRVSKYAFPLLSLVAALVLILYITPSSPSQTTINISSTAKQTGAKHFGINLANQSFYDNGMMLRNLIFRNPGFEGETWSTILTCQTVTTTSCQDANNYALWTANFMQGATYTFMTGLAAGETGTVTSQDAANYSGNTGIVLHYAAPSIQPASGDVIQIRKIIPGNAQDGWFILNQGGSVLSTDSTPADQAPGTTGTQCLQVTGPNAGQSVQVSQLFDTSGVRSFIQLNGSFTITFKAKSTGGSNQFNLQVIRQTSPTQTYLNQNVTLTNQWANYSYTFSAAETDPSGAPMGALGVYFNFDGNSLLLDDVQMSPDKNTYGTAYRDEVVSTLLALQPGVLRYMDTAQGMGTSFDNMVKDQFGRQRAGWSTQATDLGTVPVGLYDFLRLCQVVGAEPWWTMPTAMNQTELQHVMEYMAGPTTSTYGAIRAAQGQSAPWTTVFPVIHLELGNEVWNGGSFSGETIVSPNLFGQWANTVFTAAKTTSYYASNSSKFDFVIGSLEVNDFWTEHELDNCAACDTMAVASYMFGTFDDYSSTEAIFGPLMAYPQWLDGSSPAGQMYNQVQVASGISVPDAYGTINPAATAIYETNLGTDIGTAPQATVNAVIPSVGAGIATADHMLMMLRDLGVKTQNMFALTEYSNAFNNTAAPNNGETTPIWGTVVDMGVTNLQRPQFLAEELANTAILPTVLTTTQSGDNPTWNQSLSTNDNVQLNNVNYLQSYAFTDGTNKSVVVVNLHRTSSLSVKFSGPGAPTGNLLVRQLTSGNITDTNEASPIVNVTNSSISNATTATTYSLPPFSMTVFLWPGASLTASTTTLTATPQTTTPGQSVSLTATVTAASGTATPAGTVTFLDGTTTVGTATLNSSGVASYSTTALASGANSITAFYGGDATINSSTSPPVTVNISPVVVSTKTTITASPAASTTGQNVTFTATVSPLSGNGVPTGKVAFLDGTATIGTASLNSSGIASFSTSSLSVGTHSVSADYQGDANDNGSDSSAVTESVTASGVPPGTIPNGLYTVTNLLSDTYLDDPAGTDASVQIVQWPWNGGTDQQWTFTSNGKGYYTIQNFASNLYLTSPNLSTIPGIPLMQQAAPNDDWQLWSLVASGANYVIQNKASGLVMDFAWVAGIDLWSSTGAQNQVWSISAAAAAGGSQTIPDGNYTIRNEFSAEVLEVPTAVAGVQVIQNTENGGSNESWHFASKGHGYFTIQNVSTGQYLTNTNSTATPGVPLVQNKATKDLNQQEWLLVPTNGSYTIKSRSSGLVVDYPFATQIVLWSQDGGTNQLWSIIP